MHSSQQLIFVLKRGAEMKVAVMAGLFAEGDVEVNSGHAQRLISGMFVTFSVEGGSCLMKYLNYFYLYLK